MWVSYSECLLTIPAVRGNIHNQEDFVWAHIDASEMSQQSNETYHPFKLQYRVLPSTFLFLKLSIRGSRLAIGLSLYKRSLEQP